MTKRISKDLLRELRNAVPINDLIRHLEIPSKIRDGILRFLCPVCSLDHSATRATTNLARCFPCERNFNPIDLVMASRRVDFLAAVRYLIDYRGRIQQESTALLQNRRAIVSKLNTAGNSRSISHPRSTAEILRDILLQ